MALDTALRTRGLTGTRNGEEETLFVSDSSQLNQDSNSGERAYKASALPTIPRDPPADKERKKLLLLKRKVKNKL